MAALHSPSESVGVPKSSDRNMAGVARTAELILLRILAPLRFALKNLKGSQVWEVSPKELPTKGSAVRSILADLPKQAVAIYLTDDETDESAFEILTDAMTVKVHRSPTTHANFYVHNQGEVLRLLALVKKVARVLIELEFQPVCS